MRSDTFGEQTISDAPAGDLGTREPPVRRRRVLAGAGALAVGALMSGGCSTHVSSIVGKVVGYRLRVALVGLPQTQLGALATALKQCADLYARHGGVHVDLEVSTMEIPSLSWYSCPKPLAPCGPAVASPSPLGLISGSVQAQLPTGGLGLSVRSRTALDVKFGVNLPAPVPVLDSVLRTSGPDLIVAYDTWQYWLAPLSRSVDAWRTYDTWRQGVPEVVHERQYMFVPGLGTAAVGVPVLRDPLGLRLFRDEGAPARTAAAFDPAQTWEGLAHWVQSLERRIDTTGFMQSTYYPEGTDSAIAALAAQGGAVTDAGDLTFHPARVEQGLAAWRSVVSGSAAIASLNDATAIPQHIWSPLWGNRVGGWDPGVIHPLPSGPSGRAVPCTYLCAFVGAGNRAGAITGEYAAFLWSRAAQAVLGAIHVGLPLRRDDAVLISSRIYPWIQSPEVTGDAAGDLTLARVYGTRKTIANASQVDAAADALASWLAGQQRQAS